MTRYERRALLYAARRLRLSIIHSYRHWSPRLWWTAMDLLPSPQDMPFPMYNWAPIAESMALSSRVRR